MRGQWGAWSGRGRGIKGVWGRVEESLEADAEGSCQEKSREEKSMRLALGLLLAAAAARAAQPISSLNALGLNYAGAAALGGMSPLHFLPFLPTLLPSLPFLPFLPSAPTLTNPILNAAYFLLLPCPPLVELWGT